MPGLLRFGKLASAKIKRKKNKKGPRAAKIKQADSSYVNVREMVGGWMIWLWIWMCMHASSLALGILYPDTYIKWPSGSQLKQRLITKPISRTRGRLGAPTTLTLANSTLWRPTFGRSTHAKQISGRCILHMLYQQSFLLSLSSPTRFSPGPCLISSSPKSKIFQIFLSHRTCMEY